ncbi:hypothetical protein Q5H93_06185 [Hymenobacter sp. ASUV-10]|uniref:Holliday junction resolvase n=1 Tax=Hymenobacter aranciens TaxID=3063996 RepID=A0ABT9B9B1_9BACT|nr:hypothetical protein [Hymenobacter sp. ASUV-10]MDO7874314.1 hypothetical protein [Hymenobacter sp. ASUV-10]
MQRNANSQQHQDEVAQAESRERRKADELVSRLNSTGYNVVGNWSATGSYARIDGTLTFGNGKVYQTELKVRNGLSTQYDTGMLEVSKLNAMRRLIAQGQEVAYVFIFDDQALFWPVHALLKHIDSGRIETTSFNNLPNTSYGRNRDRVAKQVVLLPTSMAKKVAMR